MRRTALLIGSATFGLTGVLNDVETMADQLSRHGFATRQCTGTHATRAGILDNYQRLIRESSHGDAVVVYYSGHGGLADPPPAVMGSYRGASPRLQFIVPTDYAESAGSDFPGITAAELSVLLVRLTGVTANVTVILDTCHAGHMSRDRDLRVKALPQPAYVDIAEHLSRLRRGGFDPTIRHVLGNQDAVRVVACGPDRSAYEYTNDAGRRMGLLTESIALALAETGGRPVTWAGLLRRVRRRVQQVVPQQRPEAEGPALRRLFEVDAEGLPGSEWWDPAGPAGPWLGAPLTIEWGRAAGGRAHPLPDSGAVVHVGDHVYLRLRHAGESTVYVSLIAVDVESRACVVTSLDPSGIALPPGRAHVIGRDDLDGRLVGVPLRWPAGVERGAPRPAALVALVSAAPCDMREPAAGAFRDVDVSETGDLRHDVHRISFLLDPRPCTGRSPAVAEPGCTHPPAMTAK